MEFVGRSFYRYILPDFFLAPLKPLSSKTRMLYGNFVMRNGRVQISVEKLKFYLVSADDDDLSVDFYVL